jgi:hypothetical protein
MAAAFSFNLLVRDNQFHHISEYMEFATIIMTPMDFLRGEIESADDIAFNMTGNIVEIIRSDIIMASSVSKAILASTISAAQQAVEIIRDDILLIDGVLKPRNYPTDVLKLIIREP